MITAPGGQEGEANVSRRLRTWTRYNNGLKYYGHSEWIHSFFFFYLLTITRLCSQNCKLLLTILTLWSWTLLERPLVVRPLDSIPAFHGTRRFNTEFTRVLHLFLSLARPIQSTSPHPTSPRSILILSTHRRLGLPISFPLAFPSIIYKRSSSPPFVLHARPSHPPRLDYSN
jgi:hypothetical protein